MLQNSNFFFLTAREFELRASYLLGALLLEPLRQLLYVMDVFKTGAQELFAWG
jgi:hypothetical protein